jgi:hypothetical protein
VRLQLLLMALTGWLARREREVVVYLIEKPLPALPAVGRAAQFLPAGGVIGASAENWNITPSASQHQHRYRGGGIATCPQTTLRLAM